MKDDTARSSAFQAKFNDPAIVFASDRRAQITESKGVVGRVWFDSSGGQQGEEKIYRCGRLQVLHLWILPF